MKLKLISDGTNIGTKLIDEDTGEAIRGIGKISWEVDVKEALTKVTVEFNKIPVEITSKAYVELLDLDNDAEDFVPVKAFEKNIKITSEGAMTNTLISDADTGEAVGAIQNVKWEATPKKRSAKATRIKFDNRDW